MNKFESMIFFMLWFQTNRSFENEYWFLNRISCQNDRFKELKYDWKKNSTNRRDGTETWTNVVVSFEKKLLSENRKKKSKVILNCQKINNAEMNNFFFLFDGVFFWNVKTDDNDDNDRFFFIRRFFAICSFFNAAIIVFFVKFLFSDRISFVLKTAFVKKNIVLETILLSYFFFQFC